MRGLRSTAECSTAAFVFTFEFHVRERSEGTRLRGMAARRSLNNDLYRREIAT